MIYSGTERVMAVTLMHADPTARVPTFNFSTMSAV
jgi:hypothetical protein